MKNLFIAIFLGLFIISCSQGGQESQADATSTEENQEQWFGDQFDIKEVKNVATIKDDLSSADSVNAILKATVGEVCQVKGCWMNVSDGNDDDAVFVQFKDYGFFMPKDLTGKKVVMKGYAYREMTSVEDLRHFAEDEGKSEEEIAAITEPEEELKFMASGVKILN